MLFDYVSRPHPDGAYNTILHLYVVCRLSVPLWTNEGVRILQVPDCNLGRNPMKLPANTTHTVRVSK